MIEIPDDVEQWTYGKIVDLVDEGYDENDILEFKREVNLDSKRLCQSACAFSNTIGGTILFGIDNDREKSLHLHDRIKGLNDTDQLKRQIIDKINNIHPNIPIRNLKFKKSNIQLPNKKVIVILKIEKSKSDLHQYEKLFYKRVSDGNDPMDVEEVKQHILESHKNQTAITLLSKFGGFLLDDLESAKISAENNGLDSAYFWLNHLVFDEFEYFMFNQAYLYEKNMLISFSDIIFRLRRLSKQLPHSSVDAKWIADECNKCMTDMRDIEKVLKFTYIMPKNPASKIMRQEYLEKQKSSGKSKPK